MSIVARAPGKLVLLGEYSVLHGVPALVMAVDRYCRAEIGPGQGATCRLETRVPAPHFAEFESAAATGVELVDAVIGGLGLQPRWPNWTGSLDSSQFFEADQKLGLGSSAAALVTWAGLWSRAAGAAEPPNVEALILLHRRFQHGAGSGLDIAASSLGGVVEFRLDEESTPHFGSVKLPNSVGFAGIFAGSSASTPGLVGRYHDWVAGEPQAAEQLRQSMGEIAVLGRAAAGENDAAAFLAAMSQYGRCLEQLGEAMGADIVTREHREIEQLAGRFGVAYKVSGAGGGDLGIAASLDAGRLEAFTNAAAGAGFHVMPINVDEQGLVVEERSE